MRRRPLRLPALVALLVLLAASGCADGDGQRDPASGDGARDGGAPDRLETDAAPDAAVDPDCVDPDGDGHGPGCDAGSDCRPDDPASHASAFEACGDGADNDCDGEVDEGCGCLPGADGECVPEDGVPGEDRLQTLGEMAFGLLRGFTALDTACVEPRLDALDAGRAPFIAAVDALVTVEDAQGLTQIVMDRLRPLIEGGGLPATTRTLADAVALLVDPAFDPDGATLDALLTLADTETPFEVEHLMAMLDRGLDDDAVVDAVHALSAVATRHDGVDLAIRTLLRLMSGVVEEAQDEIACDGLDPQHIARRLLTADGMPPAPEIGAPEYVARADEAGAPIDGERVDVRRTALAQLLRFVPPALEDGVHRDVFTVLDAAFGTEAPCPGGPLDCRIYPARDHPLADLAWLVLEALRDPEVEAFLTGVRVVVQDYPETAEDLGIIVGDIFRILADLDLEIDASELVEIARELVPLLAEIYAADADTPRLLLRVINDLGETRADFPEQLLWTIDHVRLHKNRTCSDAPPDLARSRDVDWSAPRCNPNNGCGGEDNRAALAQLIELVSVVDCGRVPFSGGQSVGETVIDIAADLAPGTVCTIVDVFLGALDVTGGLGSLVTRGALGLIGCGDTARVVRELEALEELAESGALDFLLPLADVFDEQGQIDLLVDIFHVVARDLARDDDGDARTRSVIRRALPVIAELLREGAADVLFELVDVLVAVEATDARGRQATLADVAVDMGALFLRRRDTLSTRGGVRAGVSLLEAALEPLEGVAARIERRDGADAAGRLLDHMAGYLTDTVEVGGRRALRNPAQLPLTRLFMEVGTETLELAPEDRTCWLDALQRRADALLTGPLPPMAVRVMRVFQRAPERDTLEALVIRWLTPTEPGDAASPARDVFGPLLQVLTALLQTPADGDAVRALLRYVAAVMDPDLLDGAQVIATLDDLLTADREGIALTMARTVFDQGPDLNETAPLMDILAPIADAAELHEANACTPGGELDAAMLAEVIEAGVEFAQDEATGLPALWPEILRVLDSQAARANAGNGP